MLSFVHSLKFMTNIQSMIKLMSAVAIIAASLLHVSCAQNYKKPVKVSLKSELDSASYALGAQLGASIKKDGLDTVLAVDQFINGLRNGMLGDSSFTDEQKMQVIQSFFEKQTAKQSAGLKERESKFFAENGKKEGVKTPASGLQYEVVKAGTGPNPTAESTVKVHYTGTLLSGDVFDSSEGMDPIEFQLNGVIPGWTEGIQLMNAGSKFKFYIPSALAYGEQGVPQGGIGPNEVLIFDVELLGFK